MENLYDPNRFLPEDAEVIRTSGLYICEICGKQLYDHPQYRYPITNSAVKGCDGKFYHL